MRDTTATRRLCFRRRKTAPAALVQHRIERSIAQLNANFVHHAASLEHPIRAPESPRTKNPPTDSVIYQQALRACQELTERSLLLQGLSV
jgi:hypothetical protein